MSERGTRKQAQQALGHLEARHGASFWDGVERDIEALDVADFALFLRADSLPIEPRAAFARALSGHVAALARARWSN